jgi:8-oxo-dGTP diphosphatase
VRVVAAVVWRDSRVLLTQRPPGGPLGLMWEFPGGKIEPGESPEGALWREIEEELGVGCTPGRVLAVHRHAYPHGLEVEIHFVQCELESIAFRPHAAVHAVRWVRPEDVDPHELLAGDREFLAALGAVRKGDDAARRPRVP